MSSHGTGGFSATREFATCERQSIRLNLGKRHVIFGTQHAKYSDSPREIKVAVDEAFEAVAGVFKSGGLPAGMCDEAEEPVAIIPSSSAL